MCEMLSKMYFSEYIVYKTVTIIEYILLLSSVIV